MGIMEIGYICDILNRNPNKKIKNTLSSLLCLNQIIAECYTILLVWMFFMFQLQDKTVLLYLNRNEVKILC